MPTAAAALNCTPDSVNNSAGLSFLWLVFPLLFFLAWLYIRRRSGAFYISPDHPLMREAAQKAHASIGTLRVLHEQFPNDISLRFRDPTDTEAWGLLEKIDATGFTAIPASNSTSGLTSPESVVLPLDCILDWQLILPDGSVRGGFIAQAEIRIRDRKGRKDTVELEKMRGRFIDR